ncbi:beta-lactamase [Sphaeroforma arctica JP610]|uniref:Beta-lactamase n=1 Tax=Sphaeroforma arctica JP610 TaxID=667725 RepID=A0A0L0GBA1_9EUKA|nr:beta-lactamase [Sphaeroforma arctica JP610]KNC86166.1 beta-lactamase [Sphaeroforma arctica JP610]|eukprot:XP_014160068.1 beta-lactamase [Sphaeroforma arctica JP610]
MFWPPLRYLAITAGAIVGVSVALMRLFGNKPPAKTLKWQLVGDACKPDFIWSGHITPGWEGVLDPIKKNFEEGYEIGGHFTVYRKGEKVVDITFGYPDDSFTTPYAKDTVQLVFSSTKFVCAMAMAMLVDRGLLAIDEPIATYWPAFAQNGKESVTVGDLMSHAGGVHGVSERIPLDVTLDSGDTLRSILEKTEMDPRTWRQMGNQGYHGISRGLYANEICKIVDPKHRSINTFLEEEVLVPMGIHDFRIGVVAGSDLESRIGEVYAMKWHKMLFGILPRLYLPTRLCSYIYNDVYLREPEHKFVMSFINKKDPNSVPLMAFAKIWKDGPRGLSAYSRHTEWRQTHSPSTNGFTRAAVLARIANVFAHSGVDPETGIRFMKPGTVQMACKKHERLQDAVLQDHIQYTHMGYTDMLTIVQTPPWCNQPVFDAAKGAFVGWGGAGGSLIHFSTTHEMAVAYTMNRYSPHVCDWRAPMYAAEALEISRSV